MPRLTVTRLDDRLNPAAGGLAPVADAGTPVAAAAASADPAGAAPLDPGFGDGGRLALQPARPGSGLEAAKLIGLADGRLLVVERDEYGRWAVERRLADGRPDPAFGVGGRTPPIAPDGYDRPKTPLTFYVTDAAATPDGGAVLVGTSSRAAGPATDLPATYQAIRAARVTADGTIDTGFAERVAAAGGFAPGRGADGGSANDQAAGVAVTADGRVVIVGTTRRNGDFPLVLADAIVPPVDYYPYPPRLPDPALDPTRVGVLRLFPDGTPDPAFGAAGRAVLGDAPGYDPGTGPLPPGTGPFADPADVAVDPAGRVVLSGLIYRLTAAGIGSTAAFVARLTADGRPDLGFADGGLARLSVEVGTRMTEARQAQWVGVTAAGGVVVGGRGQTYPAPALWVVRLTADGRPDPGFAGGGVVTVRDPLSRPAADLAVGADGTAVVVTGTGRWIDYSGNYDDYLARSAGLYRISPAGAVESLGDVADSQPGEFLYTGTAAAALTVDPAGRATVGWNVYSAAAPRVQLARLADRQPPTPEVRGPAAGDLDGDGVADRVVTDGPRVSVASGADGSVLLPAFAPFEARYAGTLNAVLADVDGDGRADLVVSPDSGGGPVVAVYRADGAELGRFFGIDDPDFRGGARVAAGDLDGDGRADLVVVAGDGGGPRVAVFDGRGLTTDRRKLVGDFYAFEPEQRGGATVAVGDLDFDGRPELVFGAGAGGGPRVTVLDARQLLAGTRAPLADYFAADPDGRDGVDVSVAVRRPVAVDGEAAIQPVAAVVTTRAAGLTADWIVRRGAEPELFRGPWVG